MPVEGTMAVAGLGQEREVLGSALCRSLCEGDLGKI